MVIGDNESALRSMLAMYALTPELNAKTSTIPIIPIDPAKDVNAVRTFLLTRLRALSSIAVLNDRWDLLRASFLSKPFFFGSVVAASARGSSTVVFATTGVSSASYGSVSPQTTPPLKLMIRVLYSFAKMSLCVTITTR